MKPRIVITGTGLVSRFGEGAETWKAVLEGRDGSVSLKGSAWEHLPVRNGAAVDDSRVNRIDRKDRRMDRVAHFSLSAASAAWEEAGPSVADSDPSRRAVVVGTSRGGAQTVEESIQTIYQDPPDASRLSPFATAHSMVYLPASVISQRLSFKGPSMSLTSACASASHAIGMGARLLQVGMSDVVMVGGADACLTPGFVSMCWRSKILTSSVCRPFDKRRDGVLLGEGAGLMILERPA